MLIAGDAESIAGCNIAARIEYDYIEHPPRRATSEENLR
jgi:hypothetical protein